MDLSYVVWPRQSVTQIHGRPGMFLLSPVEDGVFNGNVCEIYNCLFLEIPASIGYSVVFNLFEGVYIVIVQEERRLFLRNASRSLFILATKQQWLYNFSAEHKVFF